MQRAYGDTGYKEVRTVADSVNLDLSKMCIRDSCLGYVENKFEEKFAPDLDENSTIITSGDRKKNIVNKANTLKRKM